MEHVNYPHEAGYLFDCPACELGPCQCSAPCLDEACEHEAGAKFQHLASCVSIHCEQEN